MASQSRLFKVVFGFKDGVMAHCPAVEFQGAIWLVPKWLPFPNEGYAKPERMIRLDQFQYQKFDPPPPPGSSLFAGADFGINDQLPRALFAGELSSQLKEQYVVLDKPDAKFRLDPSKLQ
jgi:hypothetical protein